MGRVPRKVRPWILACLLAAIAAARAGGAEPAAILHFANGDRLSGSGYRIDEGQLFWKLQDGSEIPLPLSLVKRIEHPGDSTKPGTAGDKSAAEDGHWQSRDRTPPSGGTAGAPPPGGADGGAGTTNVQGASDPARPSDREGEGSEGAVVPAAHFQGDMPFVGPPTPGQALLPAGPMFLPGEDPDAIDETDSYFASAWNAIRVRTASTFQGLVDWTEHLEVGGRTLSGNTEEDYVTAGAKFARTTIDHSSMLEFGGQWSQSEGIRRSNRWWGNGTVDYNKKGNWLFFMTTKNEYDEFENLLWRGTLSAGPGYRLCNEPDRKFIIRAGPAVTREIYTDPPNDRATADLFGEMEIETPLMWDRLLWEHKTTAIPSVEDFSLIRITTASGLSLKLDDEARWHVKLGFRHEYNSQPNPGRERGDLTTSLFLVYKRQ